ncbi:winged helix-turn-helix transcriptional regulator [Nocardia sp. NPDC058499]|uniref:winged helix-turn-helix transcriptional regulator n=1 Tax=Nocardia sp. NPDC058499 TaxID=3346530 RepID=UPI00366652C9
MAVRSQATTLVGGELSDAFNSDCPAREVLDHITSRWGVLILAALGSGPLRFSALSAMIGGISEKMLSQTLRTLVRDGLVARTVEPTTPPRVSYELTELGQGLAVSLGQFLDWVRAHAAEVVAAQERHDRQQG